MKSHLQFSKKFSNENAPLKCQKRFVFQDLAFNFRPNGIKIAYTKELIENYFIYELK